LSSILSSKCLHILKMCKIWLRNRNIEHTPSAKTERIACKRHQIPGSEVDYSTHPSPDTADSGARATRKTTVLSAEFVSRLIIKRHPGLNLQIPTFRHIVISSQRVNYAKCIHVSRLSEPFLEGECPSAGSYNSRRPPHPSWHAAG